MVEGTSTSSRALGPCFCEKSGGIHCARARERTAPLRDEGIDDVGGDEAVDGCDED